MLKIKAGDTVKVASGKDKDREEKVERVLADKELAVIPGVNMYKKHVKGRQGQKGGIYDIPRPLSFAKIMLVCPKCKKPARVGFKMAGNEKVRFCKNCKREIDTK